MQSKVLVHAVTQLPIAATDQLANKSGKEDAVPKLVVHTDQTIHWFPTEGKGTDDVYHPRISIIAQYRKESLKLRKSGPDDFRLFVPPQGTAAVCNSSSGLCPTGYQCMAARGIPQEPNIDEPVQGQISVLVDQA